VNEIPAGWERQGIGYVFLARICNPDFLQIGIVVFNLLTNADNDVSFLPNRCTELAGEGCCEAKSHFALLGLVLILAALH
jgi:hypothetical protein